MEIIIIDIVYQVGISITVCITSARKYFLMLAKLFVFLGALSTATAYDWTSGNLALWHSEATYCDPSSYLNRTYKGPLAGFVPVYAIYDKSHGNKY
jgi:hypothetical protein